MDDRKQNTYTNWECLWKTTSVEVAKCVSEAWRDVSIKTIKDSFRKAGIIVSNIGDKDCSRESNSSDEEDADDPEREIDLDILSLFNSDTKDEGFDGFDWGILVSCIFHLFFIFWVYFLKKNNSWCSMIAFLF